MWEAEFRLLDVLRLVRKRPVKNPGICCRRWIDLRRFRAFFLLRSLLSVGRAIDEILHAMRQEDKSRLDQMRALWLESLGGTKDCFRHIQNGGHGFVLAE